MPLAVFALVDLGLDGWPLALMLAGYAALPWWVARRFRTPAWILDAHGISSRQWLARPLPWGAVSGQRIDQRAQIWSPAPFLVVLAPGAVHRRHRRKVHDELWIPLEMLQIDGEELAGLIERRGVPHSRTSATA